MKTIREEIKKNNMLFLICAMVFVCSNFFIYANTIWQNERILKNYQQINKINILNNKRKTSFKLYCKSHDIGLLQDYYDDSTTINGFLNQLEGEVQVDNNSRMSYRLVCQVFSHSQATIDKYVELDNTYRAGIISYIDEVDMELESCINQLLNFYLEYLNNDFEESSKKLKVVVFILNAIMICGFYKVQKMNRILNNDILYSIEHLSESAIEITNRNFDCEDIDVKEYKELCQVSDTFNQMKHTIKDMILELKQNHEMKEHLAEAKIRELQMQMNPHFLFNTLSLVVRNIQLGEKETSVQLINAISKILRSSIEIKEIAIPLDDEIDLLQAYLYIQRLHLKGRATICLDVRKSFVEKTFLIPPLTIQPLVENSVKHGLRDMISGGQIDITVTEYPQYMEVIVADNGKGFMETENKDEECNEIPRTSIGLNNVKERLRLYYKEEDVIRVERVNGITKVKLKLYRSKN